MKNALEKYHGEIRMIFDNENTANLIERWSSDIGRPFYEILDYAGIRSAVYMSNLQQEELIKKSKYNYSLDAIISGKKVKFQLTFWTPIAFSRFLIITGREKIKFRIRSFTTGMPFAKLEIIKEDDRKKVTTIIQSRSFHLEFNGVPSISNSRFIKDNSISIHAKIKFLQSIDSPNFIECVINDIVEENFYFGLRDIKKIVDSVDKLLCEKREEEEIIEVLEKYQELFDICSYDFR